MRVSAFHRNRCPPSTVFHTEMLGTLGPDCILLGDRGYDSDALRVKIAERGAYANIRPLDHRVDPRAFSPRIYKLRNKVERFFNRIKHCRAIATHYDKQDASFLASVKLAAIRICIGFNKKLTRAQAAIGVILTS